MVGIPEGMVFLATIAATLNTTLKGTVGIGIEDLIANAGGNLLSDGIKGTVGRFSPQEKQRINHDLQQAFRDAIYEALYDLGDPGCFRPAWQAPRDVPADLVYWPDGDFSPRDPAAAHYFRRDDTIDHQLCRCLWHLGRAIKEEHLLPLVPPLDDAHASVYGYLQPKTTQVVSKLDSAETTNNTNNTNTRVFANSTSDRYDAVEPEQRYRYIASATPQDLAHAFFAYICDTMTENIKDRPDLDITPLLPKTNKAQTDEAQTDEAERLRTHLRDHLLPRTLIHLDECLKSEKYTAAWRAFNRLLLEGLRDGVAQLHIGQAEIKQSQTEIKQSQQQILERLDLLLKPENESVLGDWSTQMAAMVQATGRIEQRQQTSFVVLLKTMQSQHGEVMSKLDDQHGTVISTLDTVISGQTELQKQYDQLLNVLARAHAIADPYDVSGLENPYLGLAAFTYAERERYAGHPRMIAVAEEKLTTPGEQRVLLFITGASGSGKSSFAQAGLIPALERYYAKRHTTVRHAVFRPSKHPLAMLGDAFQQLNLPTFSGHNDPHAIYAALETHTDAQTFNVVIIDQFEELFTQSEPAQRDAFLRFLENLPAFEPIRTHLIATLRADYLPELFNHQHLYDQTRAVIDLRTMPVDELKVAIQRPLQQHPQAQGRQFEPGLLDELATQAATDAALLPLLQVTLEKLWGDGKLTLADYHQNLKGNLFTALREKATQVYTTCADGRPRPATEKGQMRALLLDLVDVSPQNDDRRDVRRRRPLNDLVQAAPERRKLINELTTARLLKTEHEQPAGADHGIATVEIIHESLLHNWTELQQWIAEDRTRLQRRKRFEIHLGDWRQHNRSDERLLHGIHLAEAEELDQQDDIALRDGEAREFLQRSRALREQERLRRIRTQWMVIAVLAVLLVLAIGAAFVAFDRQRAANEQLAVATSRQLAIESSARTGAAQYDIGLLLGVQAAAESRTQEAQHAILAGLPPIPMTYLHGHTAQVTSATFSPDGQTLASAGADMMIILWDVASGQPRATLEGHTDWVRSVAFSPDGQTLASAGQDNMVMLWNVASGEWQTTLEDHKDRVTSVAFSPDGSTLASASDDTTIRLWDVTTGEQQAMLEGHAAAIRQVAFSPDGSTLASASNDRTVMLWDVVSRRARATLKGHTDEVLSVAFSPDGQMLASASVDGTVILWDATTGERRNTLEGHQGPVYGVTFRPDGQTLALAGWDRTIILWEVDTGQARATLRGHTSWLNSVAFSPDGSRLASASGDQTIILWDVAALLRGHTGHVYGVAFSPDGQTVASASDDTTIILWDAATGQPRARLTEHTEWIRSVAFSPDGQTLASASGDRTVMLWDVTTGKQQAILEGHTDGVRSVAFSPDGQTLASASFDTTIRLWDVNTGEWQATLPDHTQHIWNVAFSPDGQTLASASGDQTVILWEVATRQARATLRGHTHEVMSVAFSPDGQTLASASADNTVILWDVATGQLQARLPGGTRALQSVAFSPDGRFLVAGSYGEVLWWEVATRQALPALHGHTDWVWSLAFSPDGQTLASASWDGNVILWDVAAWQDPQVQATQACRIANRNLSWDEWQRYLSNRPYAKTCPGLPVHPSFRESGHALARAGDLDGAVARFREVLALDPDPPFSPEVLARQTRAEVLVEEGEHLARDNDIDGAVERFTRAKTLNPALDFDPLTRANTTAAAALVEERESLARDNDIDGAVERFTQAKKLDPALELDPALKARETAVAFLMEEGERLARSGNLEGAEERFTQAKKLDPALELDPALKARDTAVAFLMEEGERLARSGNLEGAEERFVQAQEINLELDGDPRTRAVEMRVAALMEEGGRLARNQDHAAAIAEYTRVLELDPNHALAHTQRGDVHYRQKAYDDALADYDAAIALEPANATFYYDRAFAYGQSGNYPAAIEDFSQAIALNHYTGAELAAVYGHRAYNYIQLEAYTSALADYDAALALDVENDIFYDFRATTHFRLGNDDLAVRDAHKAAELRPDRAGYQAQLCLYAAIAGPVDPAGAIMAACDQALTLDADNATFAGWRGVARARAGDMGGAAADLARYLAWLEQHQADATDKIGRHRAWLAALEAGTDPFDAPALAALREWYGAY